MSTVTVLVGCTPTNFVVGDSTCAFHGVSDMSWSRDVTGIWPAGTNRFKCESRAVQTTVVETAPHDEKFFFIDGEPPNVAVTLPNLPGHRAAQLTTLSGTAADVGLGQLVLSTAKFKIIRSSDSKQWNGTVFFSSNAVLPAAFLGGNLFTLQRPGVGRRHGVRRRAPV